MKRLSLITMVLLVGVAVSGCATQPSGKSVTLFDGTSLANWDVIGDGNWRLEGGTVVADKKTGKDNGYLVSKKSYSNFELKVEFWVSDDANSGIFMRCKDPKKISDSSCYEANIFDQRGDPYFGTGAIVKFAGVPSMIKAGGKWNTYEIRLDGPHLTLTLNGVRTDDTNNGKYKSGPIALQYGKGVVKFRKEEITPL